VLAAARPPAPRRRVRRARVGNGAAQAQHHPCGAVPRRRGSVTPGRHGLRLPLHLRNGGRAGHEAADIFPDVAPPGQSACALLPSSPPDRSRSPRGGPPGAARVRRVGRARPGGLRVTNGRRPERRLAPRRLAGSPAPDQAEETGVPGETLTGSERQRYFRLRRQRDPLGEGQPCTWRTLLIRVAAEVVVRTRRIVVRLSASWPHLDWYRRVCERLCPALPTPVPHPSG
jgi:hypothetical protein